MERPQFGLGRKANDYGLGFYCTEDLDMAKEWACTYIDSGFANEYSLDMTNLKTLNLNSDEYTILNWMAVLLANREFRLRTPNARRAKQYLLDNFYVNVEAYDVIKGYRADDSYYDFADDFLNNAITVNQLARALTLGKLGEQIIIKSQFAFTQLEFKRCSPADKDIYYPRRKARNDEALNDYISISNEDDNGLYLSEIVRGKVRNDDERIPRNVPAKSDD